MYAFLFVLWSFRLLSQIYYHVFYRAKKVQKAFYAHFPNVSTILINRTDRLGDAMLTLPFCIAFQKQLAQKYPNKKMQVLTSAYNNFVLSPFVSTQITESAPLMDVGSSKWKIITDTLALIFGGKKRKLPQYDTVLLDIKRDEMISEKFSHAFRIHEKSVLMNMRYSDGIVDAFGSFFDNSLGHWTNRIKRTCLDFFQMDVTVEECPQEIIDYAENVKNANVDAIIAQTGGKFGIVYVGNRDFRNFSIPQWHAFITQLQYNGTILLLDDQNKKVIPQIASLGLPKNIVPVYDELDLWSLFALSAKADFFIGIDGGGFNFGHMPTNAFEIIFNALPFVCCPYSQNPYSLKKVGKYISASTTTSQNCKKTIFYPIDRKKVYYEVFQTTPNPPLMVIDMGLVLQECNLFLQNLPERT